MPEINMIMSRTCTFCVMDDSDPGIFFDDTGRCNHCRTFEAHDRTRLQNHQREETLQLLVNQIKKAGRRKPYDCIMGISGGVDSTYVALLVKELGLRPLAVHFDNGWNSELAVRNIENIIKKLDIDLYTYVVDWEEFRDLQRAYLKASVIDVEAITDHAILALLHKTAISKKVRYILSGANTSTEAILPSSWIHSKLDSINLKAIHGKYGKVKLKTFPVMGILEREYYYKIKKTVTVPLLDYVHYVKAHAVTSIQKRLSWKNYGGKHYESIFTRFYQGFILPYKFNIDKRKAHLSTLICSGQLTREEAFEELAKPIYSEDQLKIDREYVLKKLGFSENEFEDLMKLPQKSHRDYKAEQIIYDHYPILKPFSKIIKAMKA